MVSGVTLGTSSDAMPRGVASARAVAAALVDWHARHGRHDLPWQRDRTPYRVWVSEIMLQQTQVATVVPYYERFLARFPHVCALADAPIDEVLHLWSGLGYYARARNLHSCAQRIRDEHAGEFPERFEDLAALPGIGRSTAGAILALSRGARCAILDGNVRRVLSRYFGIEADPGSRAGRELLWQTAELCTPHDNVATYTQAIMDLGATLCTRRQPRCECCPLRADCIALASGRQHAIPPVRTARARRTVHTFMLVAQREDGGVLLTRRPARGVWGGLWCPPQFETREEASVFAARMLREARAAPRALEDIQHTFTHFDLTITPLHAPCAGPASVLDGPDTLWYTGRGAVGLPAPVKLLLAGLSGVASVARAEELI
jgi:A/G-specific adenine glycosylase